MKKRNFIVDYEVTGTMQLMCRSAASAKQRGTKLLEKAVRDLRDASTYCEAEVTHEPIDVEQRIALGAKR